MISILVIHQKNLKSNTKYPVICKYRFKYATILSVKKGIHPKVHTDTKVTCACGATFVTNSTLEAITIDICSACHPFYTGKAKFVDAEGRIEKFEKKAKIIKAKKDKAQASAKAKIKATKDNNANSTPKSLKDMLKDAKASN